MTSVPEQPSEHWAHPPADGNSGQLQRSAEFNPFQVVLSGGSAVVRKELVRRVVGELSRECAVGHVAEHSQSSDAGRHDRASLSVPEAAATLIEGDDRSELSYRGAPGLFGIRYSLLDCDAVIVEGEASSDSELLQLHDEEGRWPPARSAAGSKRLIGCVSEAEPIEPPDVPHHRPHDIAAIAALLRSHWLSRADEVPLYGLVLAGGRSERMGRPKWQIEYRGEPQALALHRMLAAFCSRTFLSIREDQANEPALAGLPQVIDRFLGMGPLGGILSAMTAHPHAAWLVVACDLPYLEAETLRHLVDARAPLRFATSFRSPHDGLPEPVCAIYEPKARLRLFHTAGLGYRCPRKMLMNSRTAVIESPHPLQLANANHPHEYREARARLSTAGAESHD